MITKLSYAADYETITRGDSECVWLWDVCNMVTLEHIHDTSMDTFIDFVNKLEFGANIYFHNLKFDGSFLINHMLTHGYSMHVGSSKMLKMGEFSPLITEFGQYMSITFRNYNNKIITFIDSLKIIPLSIKKMAKDFNLSIKKGEIDYNKPRPVGYIPTDEEIDYIHNDTEIAAQCIRKMLEEGHDKITISSCAFQDYKQIVGQRYRNWFGKWESECDMEKDTFIRQAYRGGFCQPNKKYVNTTIKQPVYYNDVNSLYPHVMRNYNLPYGEPVYFEGEYKHDDNYPYYVQRIRIDMSVKEDGIPCILYQSTCSGSMYIVDTLEQSEAGGLYEMTVTNFDMELIYKNYDIFAIEFLDGYKFKVRDDMFHDYVDKYIKLKEKATIDGNGAMRTIAKLLLNSLYGKFGQNPKRRKKLPYIDDEGKIKFDKSEWETVKKFKYLPVAVFITAIARHKIISDIMKIGIDNWVYSDTDSILTLVPLPTNMTDNVKLGKYKVEHIFKKTRVLGAKTYYGIDVYGEEVIRVCGCTRKATPGFPIGLFNYHDPYHPELGGIIRGGRTTLTTVKGGKKIRFGDFQIKDKRKIHIKREWTIRDIKEILDDALNKNKTKIIKNTINKNIINLLKILMMRSADIHD